MAAINRTATISTTAQVTAATLHNLIESATLGTISGSDLTGGGASLAFVVASTATPNPATSRFWYDTTPSDPVFRVYASPYNIWLAAGPDRFEIPLYNLSGTFAAKGSLVVAAGPGAFNFSDNPGLNTIGFLQSDTPASTYGPVATCGIGWATWVSGHSGTTNPAATRAIIARGCPLLGTCTALGDIEGTSGSGPMFGMYLESTTTTPKLAIIWGPRLTE